MGGGSSELNTKAVMAATRKTTRLTRVAALIKCNNLTIFKSFAPPQIERFCLFQIFFVFLKPLIKGFSL